MAVTMGARLVILLCFTNCFLRYGLAEASHDHDRSSRLHVVDDEENSELAKRDPGRRQLLNDIENRLHNIGDIRVNSTNAIFGKLYSGYVQNDHISTFMYNGTANQVNCGMYIYSCIQFIYVERCSPLSAFAL